MNVATQTLTAGFALCVLASVTGCDDGTQTIGPEGGVVVSADGRLAVEIPAGALDEDIQVSIHRTDDAPEGALRAYAIEPMFTPLALPASVEYDWSVSDGADGLVLDKTHVTTTLVIQRDVEWLALPDLHVDSDERFAVGSTHYLGVVAVVAE